MASLLRMLVSFFLPFFFTTSTEVEYLTMEPMVIEADAPPFEELNFSDEPMMIVVDLSEVATTVAKK